MPKEKPSFLKIWIAAARPRTLPAAIAPVLVGTTLAWHDLWLEKRPLSWAAALACLGFALLIQIGTNFANDYYDFIKGADTKERVGPRRAVAAGLVSPEVMKSVMLIVFMFAFLVGLSLLKYGGWPLLVVGVTSILCGIAYTGGPYPLGYNGLGDIFVFIFFGLVAVCATFFVQTGYVSQEALLCSVGVGLLATNILVVNNYRDVDTDRVAGKRTLVVRFGRRFARVQFGVSLLVALTIPLHLLRMGYKPVVLLPLLLVPLAWRHTNRLAEAKTADELIALLGDTGKLLALYAVLLSAGVLM
ncbi:MAG: 1,4-dihydroxy-2-naphthoate polyprenyltransferase [Nibricoccus sp.]